MRLYYPQLSHSPGLFARYPVAFIRSLEMTATVRNLEGQDEVSILREIQAALQGLKFGAVEITVHNGQVVQIERKEKFRLNPQSSHNT